MGNDRREQVVGVGTRNQGWGQGMHARCPKSEKLPVSTEAAAVSLRGPSVGLGGPPEREGSLSVWEGLLSAGERKSLYYISLMSLLVRVRQ